MIYTIVFIITSIILVGLLTRAYKNRRIPDIDIPEAPVRSIWYGYYGRRDNQVAETKDHTNLLWESQFEGLQKASEAILEAKMDTLLDVHVQLFKDPIASEGFTIRTEAAKQLRVMFDYLRSTGALKYIKILYPIDEPNITVATAKDLSEAIRVLKLVASEYYELIGVKYAVIYAAKPVSYTCHEEYDYIGVDDYQFKSQIFTNGTYASIKALGKQTFIVPGGSFDQDPGPFFNFANGNPEVVAIIPFVWFGPRINSTDEWVGIKDQGIRKQAYINVGKSIVEKAK